MIPVKTMPRFKCDFCKKRSIKSVMEKHEPRCFRNPNRFCDRCENTGTDQKRLNANYGKRCPYCAKFDKQMLAEIEQREAANL